MFFSKKNCILFSWDLIFSRSWLIISEIYLEFGFICVNKGFFKGISAEKIWFSCEYLTIFAGFNDIFSLPIWENGVFNKGDLCEKTGFSSIAKNFSTLFCKFGSFFLYFYWKISFLWEIYLLLSNSASKLSRLSWYLCFFSLFKGFFKEENGEETDENTADFRFFSRKALVLLWIFWVSLL